MSATGSGESLTMMVVVGEGISCGARNAGADVDLVAVAANAAGFSLAWRLVDVPVIRALLANMDNCWIMVLTSTVWIHSIIARPARPVNKFVGDGVSGHIRNGVPEA